MRVAFWTVVLVIGFFWLLGIASKNAEHNSPMMNTAGEPEDCSQWSGEGWNMCIVDQLQQQDAESFNPNK